MASDQKVERERRWRGHLSAWKTSSLSQAAYCRRHGLRQNDFSWWKREIARRDRFAVASPPAFVPVQIAPAPSTSYSFELALSGGRVLRFDSSVDAVTLDGVVRVLERGGSC